jgi:hypothetical protein
MKFWLFHYDTISKTSSPNSKLVLSTSNFWKKLDPNQEFQNFSYLREPPMLIIDMEGFYFDT